MIRPPKPPGRPAVPRYKSPKPKSTKSASALAALRDLTYQQPSYDHFSDFMAETNSEKNDRGAAILLATNVENALQGAILSILKTRPNRAKALFGVESPMGTFSNTVQMTYFMDIFGDETKLNLDIIRTVRNAFAHAKIPIKFETAEVKEACSHLIIPKLLAPHVMRGPQDHLEGRKRFQRVCNDVAHNLLVFSTKGYMRLDPNQVLKFQLPGNFEIAARHQALP
jgi:hypothetical protein